jgi:hypothetical protein
MLYRLFIRKSEGKDNRKDQEVGGRKILKKI